MTKIVTFPARLAERESFYSLIQEGEDVCDRHLPLHFIHYLTSVLLKTLKIDRGNFLDEIKDSGIRAPITQKLLECSPSAMVYQAGTLPPEARLFAFKEIGDVCIVLSSFQGIRKRLYSVNHLVTLGVSCYHSAGRMGYDHGLHTDAEAANYYDYARNFEVAVDVLTAMQASNRAKYFHKANGENVLLF